MIGSLDSNFQAVQQVPLPPVRPCLFSPAAVETWRLGWRVLEWLVSGYLPCRWRPTFSSGQLHLVLKLEILCSLERLLKHIEFFLIKYQRKSI